MLERSTLVVVADRTKARFLARRAHHEDLVELVRLGMQAGPSSCEHDDPDEASGFFLADIASQISEAMWSTRSKDLVLCAEAEALASLRSFLKFDYLPGMTVLAANVVSETPEEVSRRLCAGGVPH